MLYSVEDLLSPEFGLSEGFAQSLRSFAHPIALAAGPLQMMKAEAESSVLCPTGISSQGDLLPRVAVPLSLPGGPLQIMKAEAELRFYVYRAIESKLPWPYIHKNRMTFVIRP